MSEQRSNRPFGNIRIGPLIFAIVFFVLATTNGAIMYASFKSAEEQLGEVTQRAFDQSRVSALNTFWNELNFLTSTVELASRDKNLIAFMQAKNWQAGEDHLYESLLGVSNRLDILLILDTERHVVGNAGQILDDAEALASEVAENVVLKQWTTVGQTQKALVNAVPVVDAETGQVSGHLLYGLSLWGNARFANEVRRITGSDHIEIFAGSQFQASAPIARPDSLLKEEGGFSSFPLGHVIRLEEERLAFIAPIAFSETASVDVVFVSEDATFQRLGESYRQALTIHSMVILAGSVVVLVLLMWLVVGPAKRMSRYATNYIQEGGRETFEPSWIAEFNAMGQAINGAFQELHRSNQDLRDLKDSLQDQVEQRTARLSSEVDVRRKVQGELRKLALAVEQSPIMIFVTDLNGRIEYVNQQFCVLTGYDVEDAVGENAKLIKSPMTPADIYSEMWETIESGENWRDEISVRRKDGSLFWAHASIAPVKDARGVITHYVGMHEDITERKRTEDQMREAKQSAELANRAKSELMANMSHELRTPLNAILGFSATIQAETFGPVGDEKYKEYIDYIYNSGAHLLELINDILDVSAIEAGKLELHEEQVDFGQICEACQQLIQPRAEEGRVQLVWPDFSSVPNLKADARRLKQVFLNLLSNAVKFTLEGGRVETVVEASDSGFIVKVRDNGIGMSPDDIIKAMSKFGQVDGSMTRKHEGTGLGLPLTKSLVELHGGRMMIHSEEGLGTVVTVWLPPERVMEVAGGEAGATDDQDAKNATQGA